MAIDFTALFTKLGRVLHIPYLGVGAQAALPAAYSSLFSQYTSTYHEFVAPIEAQEDSLVAAAAPAPSVLQQLAATTIIEHVRADIPSQATTLALALAELIRQMKAGSESVKACTVSATAAVLTGPANTGNGAVVLTTKRGDGLVNELLVAESARLTCTADSYTGRQTAARETFAFVGVPQTAGRWDYTYPTGSGASSALRVVDPSQDAQATLGGANVLANSDLETWSQSPLQPENFTITSGAWATDVVQDGTAHTGSFSAKVPATKTPTFYQQFGSTSSTGAGAGTATSLTSLASYAVNLWLRRVSSAITTGTLVVDLFDGSSVIADDAGNNNTFSITLSGLTTSWAAFGGSFRLPSVPPATVRLRIRVSVAADQDFLLDDIACAAVSAPYPGGPGMAVFAGSAPWKTGDGWTLTLSNDRGGSTYGVDTFQHGIARLLGTERAGILLPVSGSPSQADSLITS
jgi:hypothetical protein